MYECDMDFRHYGSWGDKELSEHEKYEEAQDNKTRRWLGFDEIRPFKV